MICPVSLPSSLTSGRTSPGLYLHTVLAVAFVTEGKLMKWLYVIGWLMPVLFTAIYALVRGLYPGDGQTTSM